MTTFWTLNLDFKASTSSSLSTNTLMRSLLALKNMENFISPSLHKNFTTIVEMNLSSGNCPTIFTTPTAGTKDSLTRLASPTAQESSSWPELRRLTSAISKVGSGTDRCSRSTGMETSGWALTLKEKTTTARKEHIFVIKPTMSTNLDRALTDWYLRPFLKQRQCRGWQIVLTQRLWLLTQPDAFPEELRQIATTLLRD